MKILSIWAFCVALLTTLLWIKRYIQPVVLLMGDIVALISQLIDGGATGGTSALEKLDQFLEIAALLPALAARCLRLSALHDCGGPGAG